MKQILIVDDSETSLMYLKKMLEDYEIVTAISAKEMWERLDQQIPSLILMDVMLPDANGYDLVNSLSKMERFKDIPIIFQTAKSSSDDLKKGFDAGAIDYIRKPVEKKELRARIKSVLKIKELENELYLKTITDYLTGVFNRRHFFDIADKHLEISRISKKNLSIGILDIDFFKKVNDVHGHTAGDFVLKKFSEIILKTIRAVDIFARYGGEEFIILFLETEKQKAKIVLEKAQIFLREQKFLFNEKEIQFTFSSGVVDLFEIPVTVPLDYLIKVADKRLYIAKETGRNKIVDVG